MRRPSQVAKLTVQPKGFFSLCIVELLGRFAFYMLLGVLVLYISDAKGGGLALSTNDANNIYGGYLALVFFTPVFGGVLAEKWLGLRPAPSCRCCVVRSRSCAVGNTQPCLLLHRTRLSLRRERTVQAQRCYAGREPLHGR